ncbi:MAG: hypothetical protein KDJ29_18845, partial [Hyphomicrobiales bacterium]|nr:hypothetical protein [Hyphomicrobiales bacterium]
RGLSRVATTHVLYMDSDDDILPGLRALLDDILQLPLADFDFCIFRHVDSRLREQGRPGPLDTDQAHWSAAGISAKMQWLTRDQAARLCRVSAYPWNKVYRTAFLLENDIRCTEIPVHNDIELHWRSFFHARNIYASDSLCVEHFITENGQRLTNRKGEDRLRVFEALEPLRRDMSNNNGVLLAYADALVEFHLALFHWIASMLDRNQADQLKETARDFLMSSLSPAMFSLIALRDPRLATRVNDFLERGVL